MTHLFDRGPGRRTSAPLLLLFAAACSGGSSDPGGPGTSSSSGAASNGDVVVTSGGPLPDSVGYAYYAPSLPGGGDANVLNIVFTSEATATCGSNSAIVLATNGFVAGASAVVISVGVPAKTTLPTGSYAWENFGGAVTAWSETAEASCGYSQGGIYGGLVTIDSIDDTEVKGSFRLDIDTPSTVGTFAVPLCGTVPSSNANNTDTCVQP